MTTVFYTIGSVLAVSLVSLVGIVFIGMQRKVLNRLMFFLISFAVGGLIGDVFIHILPEMVEMDGEFFATASLMIAAGILLSFMLEKVIHWHHCHTLDPHDHHHAKPLGMIALVGDATHNVLDGILIAGSFLIDVPTGIATTIAVILHEIPQEIGDFAILVHSGYSKGKAILFNLVTAFAALAGAVFVLSLQSSMPNIERYVLPLVAGNFLYIAVADLLPELHKQTNVRHSIVQFMGVFAGIGLMFLLTFLE